MINLMLMLFSKKIKKYLMLMQVTIMVLRLWIILISSMIVFHHQDSAKSSGDLYLYSSKSGQNPLGLDGEYLLKVSTDFEVNVSIRQKS